MNEPTGCVAPHRAKPVRRAVRDDGGDGGDGGDGEEEDL